MNELLMLFNYDNCRCLDCHKVKRLFEMVVHWNYSANMSKESGLAFFIHSFVRSLHGGVSIKLYTFIIITKCWHLFLIESKEEAKTKIRKPMLRVFTSDVRTSLESIAPFNLNLFRSNWLFVAIWSDFTPSLANLSSIMQESNAERG